MAQQYPQQGGRGGQPGRGGRGGVPYNYAAAGRGGGAPRTMGAWQPSAPTSLQQAAGAGAYQQQQQQQQQQPRQPYPPQMGAPPPYYHNPYTTQPQYGRQQWQGQQAGYPQQQPPPPPQAGGAPPQGMRGGVFYPQNAPPAGNVPAVAPVAPVVQPRPKKPLLITDKEGNVLDLTDAAPKKSSLQAAATAGSSDAGAKMRQAALERIEGKDESAKKEADDKAKKEADDKAKKEAEEKAKKEAETKKEAEEKTKKEAEEKAKQEADAKAKKEAEEKAKKEAEEKKAAGSEKKSSLAALLSKPPAAAPAADPNGRKVYTKKDLLRFKAMEVCMERPGHLPDMTIIKGQARGRSGGNRGGGNRGNQQNEGGDWSRGQGGGRRQSGGGGGGGGHDQWSRGQAPPKNQNQNQNQRGGNRNRNSRNNQPPLYDGPVAPLTKSENHWRPQKNTSTLVVAEKKVKSILNKMTKEKFERLSKQMLEIPILSYETLSMMIDNVYDKAIDEPSFGDMYADLCVSLSQSVQVNKLVHIIESDEEPPTEDGKAAEPGGNSSHHTVYRWSNDVSTSDEQVVGPLDSEEECLDAALDEEERTPVERGDMELELVSVCIKRGIFMKIMRKKGATDDKGAFYAVYFPVSEAEELGQQLSDIFLSQIECENDAAKKNSFKRSLLNKCEEEFNKQDIYVDWKAEKKAYEENKSSMKDSERAEKEEELSFRRIRIKKQMLGNIKFIGQLYKKRLLKEKIMRYCIGSLLKLDELPKGEVKSKNPEYKDSGDFDLDEEDHEAICSMFTTIGLTIDTPSASMFMDVCFTKIKQMSTMKTLPSRPRFMYKDLLELRDNRWIPRRKVEKAKTLEEIRKDVEREERKQAQQSRGSGRDFNQRGGGRGGGGGDYRGNRQSMSNRPRQPKPTVETDEDGFTVIAKGSGVVAPQQRGSRSQQPQQQQSRGPAASKKQTFSALADEPSSSKPKAEPLSQEKLERRIKSMRSDFVSDGGNVDELMLSMDEISGTPDAGIKLVSLNSDRVMDCKDDERNAIFKIITILIEKGKLTKEDIQEGTMDIIEFIDSMVMDSPRAYEYLGELLSIYLRLKMIDVEWLCEQVRKTKVDPDTPAPEKIIRFTFRSLKSAGGSLAVASVVKEKPLSDLLGADSWKDISKEVS